MHATEREKSILTLLEKQDFITFGELEEQLDVSPATIRRDLTRLNDEGLIIRVRGGVKSASNRRQSGAHQLSGVPFHRNINQMKAEKALIGKAAAQLCVPDSSVMIDGGSTTLQICPHLEGMNMLVFTNSLHVVNALLPQVGTRVLVPGGSVFREQSIILSAAGDDPVPRFHAPQLFMGAASIGAQGVMQPDIVLVAAERRLIKRAEQVIMLVDHTKFKGSSGNVVCGLDEVDIVITDAGISDENRAMLENAGVEVIIA